MTNLVEMFPDWEADELQGLLSENDNSLEIVSDLIVNNKVSKWEPIKKEKHKKKEHKDDTTDSVTGNANGASNSGSSNSTTASGDRRLNNKAKASTSSRPSKRQQHPNAAHKKNEKTERSKASTASTTTTSATSSVTKESVPPSNLGSSFI